MTKSFRLALIALGALALVIGLAQSPSYAATAQGDKEVSAALSVDHSTLSSSGTTINNTDTTVLGSFGYFIDKHSQVGIAEQLSQVKTSGAGADTETDLSFTQGFYKYHFYVDTNPALVPWVGGYLGFMSIKVTSGGTTSSGSGNSYGPAAGIKYFVDENTSVNFEYQIIKSSYSITFGGSSVTVDQTDNTFLIGLSVYWGKK